MHPAVHRRSAVVSFNETAESLLLLLSEPGCPSNAIDIAARLVQHVDKCLFVKLKGGSASGASEHDLLLQPSDLFLRFVAAFRAKDWPLIRVIEHEASS